MLSINKIKELNILKFIKRCKSEFMAIGIIAIVAFFMLSPQLYKHSIILGFDGIFHMNRVYEWYMQLVTGEFNYFQSLYGFQQSGRIVNAMYSPDFSFLQAIILIFAKNWFRFQLINSFLCFFISGVTMYSAGRYLKLRRSFAIVAAILYMSASSIVYYAVWQTYASWGAAFFPLLMIPASRMILNNKKPINPYVLALTMSILLSVHIASAILGVLALIPFSIVCLLRSKQKLVVLKDALLSVGIALILSGNIIYGMLKLSLTNKMLTPYLAKTMLFTSARFSTSTPDYYNLGLIFSIIFIFLFFYVILFWKRLELISKVINSTGLFFLFISSNLLPWDDIAKHFTFIQFVQFPIRFTGIAFFMLILGLSIELQNFALSNKNEKLVLCLFITISILSCSNANTLISQKADVWRSNSPVDSIAGTPITKDPNQIRKSLGGSVPLKSALDTIIKGTPDYLPVNDEINTAELWEKDPYKIYFNEVLRYPDIVEKKVENGSLVLNWHSSSSGIKQLPVIAYEQSLISLNGKKLQKKDYKTSEIGSLIIKEEKGHNTLTIGFKKDMVIGILLILKIVTLIIVCSILALNRVRN